MCANSRGQNYRKSLDTGSWILTNEGAGCEETEVSINERKGQSGGVFQAEGRAEAQNTTCDCVLVVHRDYSPNSRWEIMGHQPETVNVWISFCEPATFKYIYIYIFFFKQQNPFYQLTFSSAESSNWLELNAESFGWRGSLMPNCVLHIHTHTYTHKHTDTHTGPGGLPRTQSFKGHGLKVLWWRQGFRKCLLGQAACLSAHKGSQFQSERGNFYKTYTCRFYTEPSSRSEHTTKDSPAGPSILKWWGPGLLWIPKTLELGLTLRDVWEVLLGWVASRGNRRSGCTSLLYSLLGWVCYILYLLMPEAQPGLQSVLVGI